jgi:hypothetical protein
MIIFVTSTDSEFIYIFKHSLKFVIFLLFKWIQSVLFLPTVLECHDETV